MLPSEFSQSLERLAGCDVGRLSEALDSASPVSVRFNPFKVGGRPEGRQVPWCRYGYYLDERPQFTLDPLLHGGAYYVQEASSMFIEHIFRQAAMREEGLKILDLCAAPGGKTTLLSTLAGPTGVVVANEVVRNRALVLADNVLRWGIGNVVVTNNDPSHFGDFRDYFDVILVDAPCSGEGMFRKSPEARAAWSPENVRLCAGRQRRILGEIWGSLKPGGLLIYSTCTFNTAENEENIEWLAGQYDCEGIGIDVPDEWNIVNGSIRAGDETKAIGTFRFFPHRVEGEGFFAAAVRKPHGKARTKTPKSRKTLLAELPGRSQAELRRWVNQPEYMHFAAIGDNTFGYYDDAYPVVRLMSETMSVVSSGIAMGQLFNGRLKPGHSLALFHDLSHEPVACCRLVTDEALDYLRKKELDTSLFSEGMNLVCFGDFPIGWAKRIGPRVNNMYPKELRILNL